MAGIEQTTQVVQAVGTVAAFLRQARADGWSWDDLSRAMQSQELRASVVEAVRGAQQIPGEITDLDLTEVFDLIDRVGGLIG